jgi:hypothetical protein
MASQLPSSCQPGRDHRSWDQEATISRAFRNFGEFYPIYLSEHQTSWCRRLHFVGSTLVLLALLQAMVSGNYYWLLAMPVAGYGFAWIGHFAYEKNRPATFQHPLYSLLGDWVMYKDMLTGKVGF